MAVVFVLFMDLIEVLVAFLQAYIFTLLTSLFIGLATVDHLVPLFNLKKKKWEQLWNSSNRSRFSSDWCGNWNWKNWWISTRIYGQTAKHSSMIQTNMIIAAAL